VGKIFQEKYYREKGFLEANLGTRPSFAWQSILSANNLVEGGTIWRVGNGNQIRVWKDRWLSSYHSNKVQAPINLLHKDATVSELINPEINWWNIPVVEHIFPQEVADQICGMAISPRTNQDKLIWAATSTGVFSVSSAYHLQLDIMQWVQAGVSLHSVVHPGVEVDLEVKYPTVKSVILMERM